MQPIEPQRVEICRIHIFIAVEITLIPTRRSRAQPVDAQIVEVRGVNVTIQVGIPVNKWDTDIRVLVRQVDYALLDATFFADGELGDRDMSEIPHPFVAETMDLFADFADQERARIIFIHFNHSNPLLIEGSAAQQEVEARGFRYATEGLRLTL